MLSREEQFAKEEASSSVTALGIYTSESEEHSENAPLSISVTLSGIVTASREEHPLKEWKPTQVIPSSSVREERDVQPCINDWGITFRDAGTVTLSMAVQSRKVSDPAVLRELPRSTDTRDVHPLNAMAPRVVRVSGRSAFSREVQKQNAPSPTDSRPSPKSTLSSSLQFTKASMPIVFTLSGSERDLTEP